ncbi:hypothetical protein IQ07DRAFT_545756 [Pyrenochaeta sp. DS3sAY3a]|nr:hypothetical protein IQ07DRAFT_545756 [Pyrenochaeta sp. DS3sAY3a]
MASSGVDIELSVLRDGYPALAAWVARDPDRETFVCRKFSQLAARNILHLQAELIALEHEIKQQDEEARRSTDFQTRQASRRWETLLKGAATADSLAWKRVESLKRLKTLLREYHEALVLQSQISEMGTPNDQPLSALREFVKGSFFKDENGKALPIISGRAQGFLDDKNDLISMAKPHEEDYLTRILQNCWISRKPKTVSSLNQISVDPFDRTAIYRNIHIVRTVAALDLLLAALLLVGSIVNLYFVQDHKAKLGLIALYTILFALSVTLCTNARRAEVFASTAAFAAVLVVFVSGELGSGKKEQCLIQLEGAIWKTVDCP